LTGGRNGGKRKGGIREGGTDDKAHHDARRIV
jgi:hypothetical protein